MSAADLDQAASAANEVSERQKSAVAWLGEALVCSPRCLENLVSKGPKSRGIKPRLAH